MIARIRPETRYADIFKALLGMKDCSDKLQQGLVDFFGVKKAILTQSARSGLYFLFRSLPHKQVLIPSYTCWVVAEAAKLAQKKIEFIDIRLTDYNIDPELLRRKIKPDSIILATHQFGIPCDMDEIIQIAEENRCYVIEDNAAAFGSEYKGRKTGSFTGASVISFEFTKTLTSGRGGAILFNDEDLYSKVKAIYKNETEKSSFLFTFRFLAFLFFSKLLTQRCFYEIVNPLFRKIRGLTSAYPVYKSEPDALYTRRLSGNFRKLAYTNLTRIEDIISKRKKIASFYSENLFEARNIETPVYPGNKSPVFMRYPVRIKNMAKENFYALANKQGVDLAFTFPYSCDPEKENSPNASIAAVSVLNLPIHSSLQDKDILKIKQTILRCG